MSGLKNSPFGKRLRASHREVPSASASSSGSASFSSTASGSSSTAAASGSGFASGSGDAESTSTSTPRKGKERVNAIFGGASGSSSTLGGAESSPFAFGSGMGSMGMGSMGMGRIVKEYGDRFVPSKDSGDMRTSYHLMEEGGGSGGGPSTPSKSRIIPSESDALKEQANAIFNSILHTEVTPPSPQRSGRGGSGSGSPTRPPIASGSTLPSTPTRAKRRLFAYSSPSTTPTRRLDTPTDEAYSLSPVRAESQRLLLSPRRQLRSVCKTPYRVLDAPELADDFYLNLVDWSRTNVLGVGLGACVYLWTAQTASVAKLCDLTPANDTVSSVAWVQRGSTLAVGTLAGRVHIYDAATLQLQRTYPAAHAQRVGALAWNAHVLSSGSRDRMVHHRDVREPGQRPQRRGAGHRQEVCGLKWSGDGSAGVNAPGVYLASGGNDNKVCIWDLRGSGRRGTGGRGAAAGTTAMASGTGTGRAGGIGGGVGGGILSTGASSSIAGPSTTPGATTTAGGGGGAGAGAGDETTPADVPLWKFHEHTAAVKALAWDPHVSGVLATGGGTQDKHIRFWNVGTGTMLKELDTGSQVCNLIWSLTSHELVSTHGFSSTTAQNQICIWKYPSLSMVASLTGHTNRVLYLAMSPDGETIVTGAGDETLRFWNAFPRVDGGGGGASGSGGHGLGSGGDGWGRGRREREESRLDYGRLIR
ncbi:Fizzy-related protein-like protein [Psilocybe cubensis]|uniref:Fizzy-related protein-like protein n=2 Tax=Psilocybe cubensis TaxID=181762 RepID=A0ACB8HCW8_PSICU|nr:Fizzy-related protein-like protein [Psilocybe cubensis]KAH9485845.1 Fizzy-related protein-like protein [Psilocybe cubensis]